MIVVGVVPSASTGDGAALMVDRAALAGGVVTVLPMTVDESLLGLPSTDGKIAAVIDRPLCGLPPAGALTFRRTAAVAPCARLRFVGPHVNVPGPEPVVQEVKPPPAPELSVRPAGRV